MKSTGGGGIAVKPILIRNDIYTHFFVGPSVCQVPRSTLQSNTRSDLLQINAAAAAAYDTARGYEYKFYLLRSDIQCFLFEKKKKNNRPPFCLFSAIFYSS